LALCEGVAHQGGRCCGRDRLEPGAAVEQFHADRCVDEWIR
jgi:hypothetical protein